MLVFGVLTRISRSWARGRESPKQGETFDSVAPNKENGIGQECPIRPSLILSSSSHYCIPHLQRAS